MSGFQGYGLVWLGRWTPQCRAPGEVHFLCEVSINPHAQDHHEVYYSYLTSWNFNGHRIGDLSVESRNYPPWHKKVGGLKTVSLEPQDWLLGYHQMTPEQIQTVIVTRARDRTINDRTAFAQVMLSTTLFTTDNPIRARQRKPAPHDETVDAVVHFSHESPAGIHPNDHWNLPTCHYWEVYQLPENGNLAAIKDVIRVAPKLDQGLSLESYLTPADESAGRQWGIRVNVLPQIDGSITMYSWDDCPELQLHNFMSRMGGRIYIKVVVHELDVAQSPVSTREEDEEDSEEEPKRPRTRGTRGVAIKVGKSKNGAGVKKTGAKQKSTPARNKDSTFRKSTAGPSKTDRQSQRTSTSKQQKRGRISTRGL